MSKTIWLITAFACFLLAGFIMFLTVGHPEVLVKGIVIAGTLVAIGMFPVAKAMGWLPAGRPSEDDGA